VRLLSLQNCELSLDLMSQLEDVLVSNRDGTHPMFRLFLTASPTQEFPLSLLQSCVKVSSEPPSGLRAGMLRAFSTCVDQDKLDRVDTPLWRRMLFTLCFLHAVVLERRKFDSLGWNQTYNFNVADLSACITYVEKHLLSMDGCISWPAVQYIVAEVQYGGLITDSMDRKLVMALTWKWISAQSMEPGTSLFPSAAVAKAAREFDYLVSFVHPSMSLLMTFPALFSCSLVPHATTSLISLIYLHFH
jgi:dynein heavy chain, axonemal